MRRAQQISDCSAASTTDQTRIRGTLSREAGKFERLRIGAAADLCGRDQQPELEL
jgi:hypothetical protein